MNNLSVVFLLPVKGGGGGAHSVVQEVSQMLELGVDVFIAADSANASSLRVTYSDLPKVQDSILAYEDVDDLVDLVPKNSIVVATIFTSVKMLRSLKNGRDDIKPAYYIQDYEPLFSNKETDLWQEAFKSYTLIPDALLFAKTEWLQNIVWENHGVKVHKVFPSIDHDVYVPAIGSGKKVICAMVRPHSKRRAPHRTMRNLRTIAKNFPNKRIEIFGCTDEEIVENGLIRDFEYLNHGKLSRNQVSNLLRRSELFLDLSDFQAFGRTGLEAMACGCIPVLPKFGGVYEYANDRNNSYIVDPRSDAEIIEAVSHYLSLGEKEKYDMMWEAINTSQGFSVRKAALSEISLFTNYFSV